MRLSAYVLATRLDQVVAAANERLGHLRDQRYLLQRTDRAERRASQAGLGLEVVDQWTGDVRAPTTLSGGETFVVSLSLALGLADVVTQEAGGTEIETLFVDEGFGTLDADTLDDVMDRLDGLRAGGRTVGVVSHVTRAAQPHPDPGAGRQGPRRLHRRRPHPGRVSPSTAPLRWLAPSGHDDGGEPPRRPDGRRHRHRRCGGRRPPPAAARHRPPQGLAGVLRRRRGRPAAGEGAETVRRLAEVYDVVYLSGRPERLRDVTERWLRQHGLPPGVAAAAAPRRLPAGPAVQGRRPRRLAETRTVVVLVDDDPRVLDAARAAGFDVLPATWMGEHSALREAQERDGRT